MNSSFKESNIAQTALILLSILLLTSVMGCNSPRVQNEMNRADLLMEDHPDSSLAILNAIAPSSLRTEKDSALYALLLTQARFRNQMPVSSHTDSIISMAALFFTENPDDRYTKMANFYKAKVLFTQDSLSQSCILATQVYEDADTVADFLWIARSSELLADIMDEILNVDLARKYSRRAYEAYLNCNHIRNHRFALCDYARRLADNNQRNRAIEILDSIKNIALNETNDSLLAYYTDLFLFPIYIDNNDYENANEVLVGLYESDYFAPQCQEIVYIARFAIHNKQYSDAKSLLTSAEKLAKTTSDSVSVIDGYARLYLNEGLPIEAAKCTDSILTLQNEAVTETLNQKVIISQASHYKNNVKRAQSKEKNMWFWITIVSSAIIFLVPISVMFISKIIKNRNQQIRLAAEEILLLKNQKKKNLDNISNLQNKIFYKHIAIQELRDKLSLKERESEEFLTKQNEINHLITLKQQQIKDVLRLRWKQLDKLCLELKAIGPKEKESRILRSINRELNSITSKNRMKELEQTLNLYFDNAVEKLRCECKFLHEKDIVFLILIFAGFTCRIICGILKISEDNFYVKKFRLLKRLKKNNVPSLPLFKILIDN